MQQSEPHHDDPRRLGDERKHGSPKRIVFVLTNTFVLGNTGRATGWDIEEFAVPYFLLAKQHYLFFASINGGATQFDPVSFERSKDNEYVKRIVYDDEARHHWEHTKRLSTLNPDHFDAIVFPGGHGAMFDLPNSQDCQHLVTRLYENGGIIASVCHGSAGFVHVKLSDGSHFVEGKRLTCFSNQEEKACGLAQAVPFLLQSELEKAGALFECSRLGQGKTVAAERLITGQNPASLNEWVTSLQLALQQPQRHERLEQFHHLHEQHEHVHHGPFKPQPQQQQQQQQASGGHYHQRVASLEVSRSEEEERPREIVITAQAAADSTSKLWDIAETQQGVVALDSSGDQRGVAKDQPRRVEEGDVQQRDKSQQTMLEKKNARESLPAAADEDVSRRGEQVGIKQDQIKEASALISPLDGDIEAAIPLLFQGGVNERQRMNEQQEADVQHPILKKIDEEGGLKKEHKGRKVFGSPEEQGEMIPPQ